MLEIAEIEPYLRRVLADARKIGRAKIKLGRYSYDEFENEVTRIARTMFMKIECKKGRDSTILIEVERSTKAKRYDFSGLDQAGHSKAFDMAGRQEATLRSAASTHARKLGLSSRVTREGSNQLRVTLVDPAAGNDARSDGPRSAPGRPRLAPTELKYPFATLELVGDNALIEAPKTEHAKIRNAASQWATRYGWKLSCSAQPDGILVTRTA